MGVTNRGRCISAFRSKLQCRCSWLDGGLLGFNAVDVLLEQILYGIRIRKLVPYMLVQPLLPCPKRLFYVSLSATIRVTGTVINTRHGNVSISYHVTLWNRTTRLLRSTWLMCMTISDHISLGRCTNRLMWLRMTVSKGYRREPVLLETGALCLSTHRPVVHDATVAQYR